MQTEQNNLAAAFLLGKLSEEEAAKIEDEFFGENNRFEEILIAENDLIDAYAKEALSAEDRQRFENRLMLNPNQRRRVAFAKTLVSYASALPVDDLVVSSPKKNWSSIFAPLFSAKPLLSYSFAVVTFAFLAGIVWLAITSGLRGIETGSELASVQQNNEPEEFGQKTTVTESPSNIPASGNVANVKGNQAESNIASRERSPENYKTKSTRKSRNERPHKPRTIISTIILPLIATRDADPAAKSFNIPANANSVNLQLKFEEGDFASYFAVVETVEGGQFWSGKIFKPRKNEKTVILNIPARLLKKGDYIIILKGLTKEEVYELVGNYSFTIN
jgi:hypothetical protein